MLARSRGEPELSTLVDAELVRLAQQGSSVAVRLIIRRHDRTLHRVARAIVRDGAEAEDVVQDAYLSAFGSLEKFRADATLSTWLTRIVVNKAVVHLRRGSTTVPLETADKVDRIEAERLGIATLASEADPERAAVQRQFRELLDRAIAQLPEPFRIVFMLRMVEQLSVKQTSSSLGICEETVRTRLHRAKKLMRGQLQATLASDFTDALPSLDPCCAS